MQVETIANVDEARKLELSRMAFNMPIEEQQVFISFFKDEVIADETYYRMAEATKKEEALKQILGIGGGTYR